MLRHTRIAAMAVALITPTAVLAPVLVPVLAPSALAQEATTTRIETRAFYGATVTLEAGVRVFRPLPPHSKVIINPGGVTPLYLGHDEYRATTHNYNYNSGDAGGQAYSTYQGPYYSPGFIAGRQPFQRHRQVNLDHRRPHHASFRMHARPGGPAVGTGGRR